MMMWMGQGMISPTLLGAVMSRRRHMPAAVMPCMRAAAICRPPLSCIGAAVSTQQGSLGIAVLSAVIINEAA